MEKIPIRYYKCVSNDWSNFKKNKIYHKDTIGEFLIEYPKDWKPVLDFPSTKEILDALEKNVNKKVLINILKQWVHSK